ncbi:MAG: hypothetical protein HWE18_06760 [Gammaproteobacteria bacterium]|nr:hypothetical protein [Gammaproteobacteria bacterium]
MKWLLVLFTWMLSSCSSGGDSHCIRVFDEAKAVFNYSMVTSKESFDEKIENMRLCLKNEHHVCSITEDVNTYSIANRSFVKGATSTLEFSQDPAIVLTSGETGCFIAVNNFVRAEPWSIYRIKDKQYDPEVLAEYDPRVSLGINEIDLLAIIKDYDK